VQASILLLEWLWRKNKKRTLRVAFFGEERLPEGTFHENPEL
jgi:hypothetical protein